MLKTELYYNGGKLMQKAHTTMVDTILTVKIYF